jgi:hypothetical protein
MRRLRPLLALLGAVLVLACGGRTVRGDVSRPPPTEAELAQLWVDPGETPRDLFWGVGGARYAPPPDAAYLLEARDTTGFSVSYDVRSPDGTEWSAKIGPEAQTEVVVSRILWGLGYHQPPVYYLPSWTLSEGNATRRETEARFRPKLDAYDRAPEYWRWADNPFVGTRPLGGLLVALLMLNSTDLKDDNNSLYEVSAGDGPSRWFVVRDLGASLGETGKLYPRRNWLEGFERSGFIRSIDAGRVVFDYRGRHRELIERIRPDDVRWAAERMSRLTAAQWRDAFRAANYDERIAARFIARIQMKIADGLALRAATATK